MERIFITGSSYFVDKHIKECLPDTDDISLEIYFGDELDKTEFFSYINSINLFGSEKFAVLRNVCKIRDLEVLVAAMSKTTECNLILSDVAKEKIDQKIIKLFKNNGFTVIAEEQKKTRATIDDVIHIFKTKNIVLNYNQAELIFNKCFNNLSMVEHEADKMELFLLSRKENVPVNILLEEISGEKEETIYALTDTFGMRNVAGTLKIYKTMDNSSDNNFRIFFALTRRVFYLYLLYIDIEFLKRVPDFQAVKIKEQQKKWNQKEIVKIIDRISELDKDIKTGIINVDNAVISLILLADN